MTNIIRKDKLCLQINFRKLKLSEEFQITTLFYNLQTYPKILSLSDCPRLILEKKLQKN